jgi:hypothetical protein
LGWKAALVLLAVGESKLKAVVTEVISVLVAFRVGAFVTLGGGVLWTFESVLATEL